MVSRPLVILKAASATCRRLPLSLTVPAAEAAGRVVGPRLLSSQAQMLQRHLDRVGTGLDADRGLGSYARYWVESFGLGGFSDVVVDRGFSFVGYDRIEDVRATGVGPLLVLPHVGGWEWAAAWLGRIAQAPVTAVAERLEPAEVFDWFVDLRSELGVQVVPLDRSAFATTIDAVHKTEIVCLLSDRDIAGTGVVVDFFGDEARVPIGPAVLSCRTKAPLLPTAVYFWGDQRLCLVGEPIWPGEFEEHPRGRRRYEALTRRLATELELMIARAPEQWHLLGPNWIDDETTPPG